MSIFDIFGIDPSLRGRGTEKKKDESKNVIVDNNDDVDIDVEVEQTSKKTKMSIILAKLGKDDKLAKEPTQMQQQSQLQLQFMYPSNVFQYVQPTSERLGPYGGSWIHTKEQIDDEITDATKQLSKQVNKLMKIEYPAQRSPKWFEMREGSITASDSGCVLGDNMHEPPYKFFVKKILKPPFEPNIWCHHGTKLEQIATMVYEYRMNVHVEEFGLVKHSTYPFLAASPDGIIGKYKANSANLTKYVGRMLEIKCVVLRKLRDDDPFFNIPYYKDQVLLQLECTNLEECDFWQNVITEYSTRDAFIDDTNLNEPFRSNKTGMEKGCLIQLLPKDLLVRATDEYEYVICSSSKFLYPPKIDMTPLECDIWVASTLNNLENVLINKVLDKFKEIHVLIQESVKNNTDKFLKFMENELNDAINNEIHKNEWKFKDKSPAYVSKVKSSLASETTMNFPTNYVSQYPRKMFFPLKHANFIKFLVKTNIPTKYANIVDDKLVEKMVDINNNLDFYKTIDENPDLKFVDRLIEFIKEMEFPKKYTFDRVLYWRVEKTLCTTVKRDRAWFAKNLPLFEKMWNQVQFLRNHPDLSKLVFEYIDKLPPVRDNHGHPLKDNDTVMNFINYVCDKPSDADKLTKYNKKIQKMMDELEE